MLAVRIASATLIEQPRTDTTGATQCQGPPTVANNHECLAVGYFAGGDRRGIACIDRCAGGKLTGLFPGTNIHPANVGSPFVERPQ